MNRLENSCQKPVVQGGGVLRFQHKIFAYCTCREHDLCVCVCVCTDMIFGYERFDLLM
jgi:hypothetical protein